ncbi:MAG: BCCT family transporter [Clostridiales Family XIII bacterium]|jgi:BCCT family betaine/carnitine transporter|nr:BCCT family transporter [Clostridiales Family XIII bacterium]
MEELDTGIVGSKLRIDKLAVIIAIVLLGLLVALTIGFPQQVPEALDSARASVLRVVGFYLMLIVIVALIFNIYLAFSKYGAIKMSKEKPEYSVFSWIAMIFCAAMGTSILYWSAIEWVMYAIWTPFTMEAAAPEGMAEAAMRTTAGYDITEMAVGYSFFHWGIPAWSIYAVGVVPLAYRYYVRKKEDLSLQVGCEGVLGDRVNGWLGRVINIIFIFGILGGLVISYGTGVPMLANNLRNIFGGPEAMEGFMAYAILVGVITVTFATSTYMGLKKGMQQVSRFTTWGSILLCVLFLVLVSPLFIVNNFVQSIGVMISQFVPMSFYLDPIHSTGFPQDWTCFYWAWWIGLAPWMWIFIAKISRGRTIRSIILTTTLAGTAGSLVFFGTISNYGLGQYVQGGFNAVQSYIDGGYVVNPVISDLVLSLPGGNIILIIWFLVAFFLLVTTMDSASYTLAAASTLGMKASDDPSKNTRLFWAVMLCVAPLSLMYSGSKIAEASGGIIPSIQLGGLQAMLIFTALPVSVLMFFVMKSGMKWLKEDYGFKTKDEIIREYMDDEDLAKYKAQREGAGLVA